MIEKELSRREIFKYNMSFYYQSTIIYFIAFLLYLIIRGEFIEDSYTLVTKDPIIYFFAIIVLISVITLIYNLYKNTHLIISDSGFSFVDRFRKRSFLIEEIINIKLSKGRGKIKGSAVDLVRIKTKIRRRSIIIRLSDYENVTELRKRFAELKHKLENRNV